MLVDELRRHEHKHVTCSSRVSGSHGRQSVCFFVYFFLYFLMNFFVYIFVYTFVYIFVHSGEYLVVLVRTLRQLHSAGDCTWVLLISAPGVLCDVDTDTDIIVAIQFLGD